MPLLNVPLSVLAEKNQLATLERFVWLYEIDVPTDPLTRYRLTRNTNSVSFQGFDYAPFPIVHDVISRDSQGDLPETTLTVSNVSRELVSTLENYDGLVGQRVKVILAHSLAIGDDGVAVGEETFEVISSQANEETVVLTLGTSNLFNEKIPKTRMMRYHCRWQYRSPECGYGLPEDNAAFLPKCDKSLSGTMGCKRHGQSYTDAGLTPIHPQRFGGFPGIPITTTGGGI